jgi:16S rRNA G966 N2-methylase RsmD
MEQCSSEQTAYLKSQLIKGETLVDLTGGFGVDCAFLSQSFQQAFYVEKNSELADIVTHNYRALGLTNISVNTADAGDYLKTMKPVSTIYIDPARRDDYGRKMVSICDCLPNLSELRNLLFEKADDVWVKYSPMLDISLAIKELVSVVELFVISVENECKELLFHLKKEGKEDPKITCFNLQRKGDSKFEFTYNEESLQPLLLADRVGDYLYEPNSSILKAGCFKRLCEVYKLRKLDVNSHLYTSEQLQSDFPGRIFHVEETSTLNKKSLKDFLAGVTKANVTLRNFPMSVDEFRKKMKIKEGGDCYLFGTTIAGVNSILKCTKIS